MQVLAALWDVLVGTLRARWAVSLADAEDGVAGMFAEVWEQFIQGCLAPPTESWFLKLLYGARSHARWRGRKGPKTILFSQMPKGSMDFVDPHPTPAHELEVRDAFINLVEKAARRWSLTQKRVFWAWAQGLTCAETAQALKISRGSSRVLLCLARKQLRKLPCPIPINKRACKVA